MWNRNNLPLCSSLLPPSLQLDLLPASGSEARSEGNQHETKQNKQAPRFVTLVTSNRTLERITLTIPGSTKDSRIVCLVLKKWISFLSQILLDRKILGQRA